MLSAQSAPLASWTLPDLTAKFIERISRPSNRRFVLRTCTGSKTKRQTGKGRKSIHFLFIFIENENLWRL